MNDDSPSIVPGGLSKEDEAKFARIVAYQTRPWELGVGYFFASPSTGKHEAFHRSTSWLRVIKGGNRSGKTRSGAIEGVWTSLDVHTFLPSLHKALKKRKIRGRIVADKKALTDEIIPLLKEYIPETRRTTLKEGHDYESRFKILSEHGNSEIAEFDLMTYDQDPRLFESVALDWIWFDEPPPLAIWNATMWRLPKRVWLTMTPLKMGPWFNRRVRRRLLGRPEMYFEVQVSIHDNEFLTAEERERALATMDPRERDAREFGIMVSVEGRVIDVWDRDVHLLKEPLEYDDKLAEANDGVYPRIVCAIDPHDRKPPFITWTVILLNKRIVIDCLPQEDWEEQMFFQGGPKAAVRLIRERERKFGYQRVEYFMDPKFARSVKLMSGKDVRSQFNKAAKALGEKVHFRLAPVEDLKARHAALRDHLMFSNYVEPLLYVSPRAMNVAEAMENYIFKENRDPEAPLSEQVTETWKDPVDCVGYTLLVEPCAVAGIRPATPPKNKPHTGDYRDIYSPSHQDDSPFKDVFGL